jgi:hypothetical protein
MDVRHDELPSPATSRERRNLGPSRLQPRFHVAWPVAQVLPDLQGRRALLLVTPPVEGPHLNLEPLRVRRIRAAEASDPYGERWPWYKTGDDATAAVCLFSPT